MGALSKHCQTRDRSFFSPGVSSVFDMMIVGETDVWLYGRFLTREGVSSSKNDKIESDRVKCERSQAGIF